MSRKLWLVSMILVALLLQVLQAAEMYEWKENGRLKLGDRPPVGIPYKTIPDGKPKPSTSNRNRSYVFYPDRHPVRPGMTADEVLDAWGQPVRINKTTYASGVHEQWVYGMGNLWEFIYLENGIVTAVQER